MDPKAFEERWNSLVNFDKHLGMKLEVRGPGDISYRLTVAEPHLTTPQTSHGGVLAAMMDAVLGLTALTFANTKGNMCSTVEFKMNYLTPARVGETLLGNARLDYTGTTLLVVSGEIAVEESGRLVAKGLGTFSQYPIAKAAQKLAKAAKKSQ